MKAAVLHAPNQPMTIEDIEIEKPKGREVLIRTAVAGLCHSDLHFIEGKYPTPLPVVLGHESSGIVEAVGADVTYLKPGDHVISCLSLFCGHCEFCLTGHMSICQTPEVKMPPGKARRLRWKGEHLNQFLNLSSFAEQMRGARARAGEDPRGHAARPGRADRLRRDHRLRRGRPYRQGRAGQHGGGHRLRRRSGCPRSTRAASPARAASSRSTRTRPSSNWRRSSAPPTWSTRRHGDAVKQVQELTSGGVHYSFECIGLKPTAEQSFSMLRSGGTATIIGMIPVGTKIELHGVDFLRERRIQGSHDGIEPLPRRHAAAGRLLPAGQAAPGRDDLGAH